MRKISTFVLAIVLALFFVASYSVNTARATGNTYYVASDGVDSVDGGTITAPWHTLAFVNSILAGTAGATAPEIAPGDTIRFKRGDTYSGDGAGGDCALKIGIAGSAGSKITFTDYGTGNKPRISPTSDTCGIGLLSGASNISIQNIDISAATTDEIVMNGAVSNISFANMSIGGRIDINDTDLANGVHISEGIFSNITFTNTGFSHTLRGIWAHNFTSLNGLSIVGSSLVSDPDDTGTHNDYGVLIYNDGVGGVASNITLDNVASTYNEYCGAVFYKVVQLSITRSSFNHNGYDGISLNQVTDVDIDDVIASYNGSAEVADYQEGVGFANSENLSITNSTINNNGLSGIAGRPRNSTIPWLDADGSTSTGINIGNVTLQNNTWNGIFLDGNGSNITINNAAVITNKNDGLAVHNDWHGVTVSNSLFSTNGVDGTGTDGDGIIFLNTTSGTIRNSRIINNLKTGIRITDTAQASIKNNLLLQNVHGVMPVMMLTDSSNETVYFNTFYGGDRLGHGLQVGDFLDEGGSTTAIVKNNIFYGFGTGLSITHDEATNTMGTAQLTQARNLFYNNTTDISGLELSNSIVKDPYFISVQSGDFNLKATSPAIDAAEDVGITTDFNGAERLDDICVTNTGAGTNNFYDIGALESAIAPTCNTQPANGGNTGASSNGGTLARTGPQSLILLLRDLIGR